MCKEGPPSSRRGTVRVERRRFVLQLPAMLGVAAALPWPPAWAQSDGAPSEEAEAPLRAEFVRAVSNALTLPAQALAAYAGQVNDALAGRDADGPREQFALLVDRCAAVQVIMLWWGNRAKGWALVGAAPVSSGLPGRLEHFETPLGVFEHGLQNPDFRAEGTRNEQGIRGYGTRGSRVYDFGWVAAPKGWGNHAMSVMRLQMHSTDPDLLEPRLGSRQSKGCIRIPAQLNEFLDLHGILDADYDDAFDRGRRMWVLRADRQRRTDAGRWLAVVDSNTAERPSWAVPPPKPARSAH